MRCAVLDCKNKHHARGYCTTHYNKLFVEPYKGKCSVPDCNNKQYAISYCSKHYSRFKDHGDPLKTTRIRNCFSITEFVKTIKAEEVETYVFTDRAQWSYACKLFYGDSCSECNWHEVSCDVDHIKSKKDGGLNTIANGRVLCPNHHAVKHRGLPMTSRRWLSRGKKG